jgi:hypothetical protein
LQFCDVVEVAIIHKVINQIWIHTRDKNQRKTKIVLHSWLFVGTYHKNLAIWIFGL